MEATCGNVICLTGYASATESFREMRPDLQGCLTSAAAEAPVSYKSASRARRRTSVLNHLRTFGPYRGVAPQPHSGALPLSTPLRDQSLRTLVTLLRRMTAALIREEHHASVTKERSQGGV